MFPVVESQNVHNLTMKNFPFLSTILRKRSLVVLPEFRFGLCGEVFFVLFGGDFEKKKEKLIWSFDKLSGLWLKWSFFLFMNLFLFLLSQFL